MKKTALLFPGQGAQYPGMGKRLYESSAVARTAIDEASEALKLDLRRHIFEGSEAGLRQTEITQPAILATSVAAFRHYLADGRLPLPQYMAGHSLGEYTALCCAGVLGLSSAVRLVHQRGRLMQEAMGQAEGDMAAVNGVETAVVSGLCASDLFRDSLWVAAYNGTGQTVIAGMREAVTRASALLERQGAEIVALRVSAPFHTPLMRIAAEGLREVLKDCVLSPFQSVVLSNVTGLPYDNETEVAEGLYRQMLLPVQWKASLEYLLQKGVYYFADAGPRKLLRNQVTRTGWPVEAYSLEADDDVAAFRDSVSGHIDTLLTPVNRALALAVGARNRNFDDSSYEREVLKPFGMIKALQEQAESNKKLPGREAIMAACRGLRQLLKGKALPEADIHRRYDRVCRETGALLLCPLLKSGL
jgi:[acyl-carrier-protein] S-malonyltransferase